MKPIVHIVFLLLLISLPQKLSSHESIKGEGNIITKVLIFQNPERLKLM